MKVTIKEGKPMDPIKVGDILTIIRKDGSKIEGLLAVEDDIGHCLACALHGSGITCHEWPIKGGSRQVWDTMSVCCIYPSKGPNDHKPEFCHFVHIDDVLENL